MQPKMGGKFHLKLNNGKRPIANKYREGKMKRTLKRELKVREIVKREANETSIARRDSAACEGCACRESQKPLGAYPNLQAVHFLLCKSASVLRAAETARKMACLRASFIAWPVRSKRD
jgi:hypothetical protein